MAKRSAAVLLTVAMCTAGLTLAALPASAGSPRSTIPGSVPAWATKVNRQSDAVSSQKVQFRVYLAMRDRAGAEALARSVSDPKSAGYHQYLSTAQVAARFAPTAATVASVRSWLASNGLQPGEVPSNHMYVEATGTTAQIAKAFGTTLGIYKIHGQTIRSADSALTVPSSLASSITGVVGVDQALSLLRPDHIGPDREAPKAQTQAKAKARVATTSAANVPPAAGFRNAKPCADYWGQLVATVPAYGSYGTKIPVAPCGYIPSQLRKANGVDQLVNQGLDGKGTTVAIIDAFASPTIYKDASTYAKKNDPAHPLTQKQFSQNNFPVNHALEGPDDCDAAGWYGEETLDVEAVHAMAPGAHIVYVGGSDCQDVSLDKALNKVVSKNLAQIVSNSYGDLGEDIPADEVQAFQSISVEAVLQGIGVYFSSGDSGDEVANLGHPAADFSASSPWVTAVGGTSLGIGRDGQKVIETGWETTKSTLTGKTWTPPAPGTYLYGSGGGTSVLFSEPFYQQGVVPNSLAKKNQTKGNKGRVVPDISMLGDPNTGMLIGITQTFPDGVYYDQYRIGGTSLASPLMAGMVALSDQLQGVRHGFINPSLYQLKGTTSITDIVHKKGADIRVDYANGVDAADGTVVSIRTFDDQRAIKTAKGYDDVTGLGVPNGAAFLFRL